METEKSAVFALPYIHSFDEEGDIFFITFKTTDEEEARTLAKCVCDPKLVEKALIILDKNG
jgi:hypothetical protein